uniref:CSON013663 protein n=1 Tax=Culicoides sonorensis TaxID=179676 RepID=A0A336LM32_CULSO
MLKSNIRNYKSARKARHKPLYLNNQGGEKTLYCYYCKEYFNRTPDHPNNFINHLKLFHAETNDDGSLTCKHCSHVSKDKIIFRRHFNNHRILDVPNVCQDCGETFREYHLWNSHRKKHPKTKNTFGCYLCGKIYKTKQILIAHLGGTHEQIGRKCKYCLKYILFEQWDEHEKNEKERHQNSIVVICEICAQTFTSKESAANHRRNFHQNKPDVTCNECGKVFRTTSNLAQHRTNTHAEKRFECRFCGYRNSYKYLVHIHIKKKHPSLILHGMPENSVVEHERGTIGLRKLDHRTSKKNQNEEINKSYENIDKVVDSTKQNTDNIDIEYNWPYFIYYGGEMYQSTNFKI